MSLKKSDHRTFGHQPGYAVWLAFIMTFVLGWGSGLEMVDAAPSGAVIRCQPASANVSSNAPLAVDLYIENVADLYGADVRVAFNPAIARVVDAANAQGGVQIQPLSDFLTPDFVAFNTADNSAGKVKYVVTQLNPRLPAAGSGPVARITFQPLKVGKLTVSFTFQQLARRDGFAISATTQNCTVNILDNGLTCAPIRDNFNRKNGGLGSNWYGPEGLGGYSIRSNQVQVFGGGPIYWHKSPNSNRIFSADQKVCLTLSKVDLEGEDQSLMLKVQGTASISAPDWRKGVIDVNYAAESSVVRVDTFQPGNPGPHDGWYHLPAIPVTFNDGDVFGARALADGTVRVYKNGVLVGVADTKTTNGNFFVKKGGRIGIWYDDASGAKFDNFGGGNAP